MPDRLPNPSARSMRLQAILGALALTLAASCSSPTGPTPPPVSTPTPTPTPPPVTVPPLTISCPADIALTAPASPANVTFAAPTTTGGVPPAQVTCTRQSGSPFTAGASTVLCTAIDAASTSASCQFSVTVNVTAPRVSRTRFLAFGDSVTAGEVTLPTGITASGAPNHRLIIVPAASYPSQLLSMLRGRYSDQSSTLSMINSGVPGEWAQDGARRLPGILSNQRPEVVLLLEGYNDLGAIGTSGITAAATAIEQMAKESRNRGARVFLSTLPPPGPGGAKGIPLSQVLSLNDRIRQIAAGEGAVFVDAYASLAVDVPRYVGVDGLHLTEAGYQKLAELFFNAIRLDLEVR
jgi:lysophospholipase L1-like esterase